ncbi:Rapamycin-insensitive companion of mTOR [Dirofilaria immitis]
MCLIQHTPDYSSEDSFNRFVLQTALTCASEAGRKWATQFLSILASHNINNFSTWGVKLLLGQLADSSTKVVRHALRLLHRWMPHYPESIYLIKDICLDGFGDAGTLLKTYLFSSESYVENNFRDALSTLDYWKKKFNMRYVEIVDENVRDALLDSKRSIDGRYARSSNERIAKLGVPMPVHLYGQLARHDIGRELLLRSNEIERLLDILRDSPLPANPHQAFKLKGALYALGHIVAALNPNLLPSETVPIICRFAECCPVLSIRGAAFWVVNLIGNTQFGSILLSSLGWESSNFIITKKSNMLLLKTASRDMNKIWIRCIDDKNPSQHNLSNEFLFFHGFWNLVENDNTKSSKKLDFEAAEFRLVNLSAQSISLPCDPDFFLKNIFVVKEFIEHSCDSLLVNRKHRINSCFYCSWSEEYFGKKNVTQIGVPNETRDEIISVLLLQGSKCSLRNYLFNRKIFSSLCLYSDFLVLLAKYNYSAETRRLVHELFADALQRLSFREACVFKT